MIAVNKMLDEMSQRAQKALSGIGKDTAATAVKELGKLAIDSNSLMTKTTNNMVGAIHKATRATQKYNIEKKQ